MKVRSTHLHGKMTSGQHMVLAIWEMIRDKIALSSFVVDHFFTKIDSFQISTDPDVMVCIVC